MDFSPEVLEPEAPSENGQPGPRSEKPPESTLDRIRARRAEKQRERHTDRDIPGYDGELVARYRPVPYEELRRIADKVGEMSGNPYAELYGQIDTLIKACEQVLIRVDGELRPIDPDADAPVAYDVRLAEILGFQADRGRKVVLEVFPSELAIVSHHNELGSWMEGTSQEVDDELMGESSGSLR